MKRPTIDNEREFDWGKTSTDYAIYRPGYPESFWDTLHALGVGTKGQRILDLGTGTGVLARAFAQRGAIVTGIDISPEQVEQARELSEAEGLEVDYEVCPAEEMDFPRATFDVISSGQSWLYFDVPTVLPRVLDAMKPDGVLVHTYLVWLPFEDDIAMQTDNLVLKYNPDWKGAHAKAFEPWTPAWSRDDFDPQTFHSVREPMPFTRESWRGRMRACRGVGASLSEEEIERFDKELDDLLGAIAGDSFTVLHQMIACIFTKKRN